MTTFGSYLRKLRRKRCMTQEVLAQKIGKNKMTVSMYERDVTVPPNKFNLDRLATILNLDDEERDELIFLASAKRNTVPGDIRKYFYKHPAIYRAIRVAQANNISDKGWIELSETLVPPHE